MDMKTFGERENGTVSRLGREGCQFDSHGVGYHVWTAMRLMRRRVFTQVRECQHAKEFWGEIDSSRV